MHTQTLNYHKNILITMSFATNNLIDLNRKNPNAKG